MVPQFHPARWKVDLQVQDKNWSISVSQDKKSNLIIGQVVIVDYQKDRVLSKHIF